MRITETAPPDITAIHDLLAEAGLPCDDIGASAKARFLMALDDAGELIGAVGIEVYGQCGLLRSLVVRADARNHGLGTRLTSQLESHARRQGIHTLYLLTTTAEKFFTAQGYRRFERERVPEDIASTAEFRHLCPANAVCMCRPLDKDDIQGNN